MANLAAIGGTLAAPTIAFTRTTPGVTTQTSEERDQMDTLTSSDGTAIAFERSGAGPAVILVDGAFCYRANGPSGPLTALLAPRFTVFSYDRRGRGDSGDTAPYAVEREVEDLGAIVDEAGGSAYVFGFSSGAALALVAAAGGLPVTKLALWEPPIAPGGTDPRAAAEEAARLAELAAGRRGDAAEFFLTGTGMPTEAVAQMRQAPWWPAMEAVEHTLAYDVTVVGIWSPPTPRVASVAVPTLVIDGDASFDWMGESADALAAALPDGLRRTLQGQTHEVDLEALAPVLEAFFAG